MRLSSGRSGHLCGVERRGVGCWRRVVPWGTVVPAPTASLEFLSVRNRAGRVLESRWLAVPLQTGDVAERI